MAFPVTLDVGLRPIKEVFFLHHTNTEILSKMQVHERGLLVNYCNVIVTLIRLYMYAVFSKHSARIRKYIANQGIKMHFKNI